MRTCGKRNDFGFTLIELLTAISIVALLMTLTLGVQRYASDKSSRSKAEVEIKAMCVACESYKVDQAGYPRSTDSDALASTVAEPTLYEPASLSLYTALSGDADLNGKADSAEGKPGASPVYLEFKPSQFRVINGMVAYIRDPWDTEGGHKPYGYSTRRAAFPDDTSSGHNPTFDIWSTAKSPNNPKAWISNW